MLFKLLGLFVGALIYNLIIKKKKADVEVFSSDLLNMNCCLVNVSLTLQG